MSEVPRRPYAYAIAEIDAELVAAFSEARKGRIALIANEMEPYLDAFLGHIEENEVPLAGTLKVVITLHPPEEDLATAPTAPHAICLAALRAVEVTA